MNSGSAKESGSLFEDLLQTIVNANARSAELMNLFYTDPNLVNDQRIPFFVNELSDCQERFEYVIKNAQKFVKIPEAKKLYTPPMKEEGKAANMHEDSSEVREAEKLHREVEE